jgi:hypothetical protein
MWVGGPPVLSGITARVSQPHQPAEALLGNDHTATPTAAGTLAVALVRRSEHFGGCAVRLV